MTERPYGVPRFAMLDIWMSLGGDSQDFEDWANDPNRFPADAWAQLCAAVASNVDALEADTNPPAGDTLLALAKRRAEIDALRSELEAMRRERDEYAAAASDLMRYYDNCFDQRLQAVPANIAIIDPIKFILGQKPCYFGRRPDDRDRLAAEWDELRAAARSVRNGE